MTITARNGQKSEREGLRIMVSGSVLRAKMSKTPDGMFKAEYAGEFNPHNPQEREIPDSHVGTKAAEVKFWVEEMAKGMGYAGVIWE